jgi:hypothetical protein
VRLKAIFGALVIGAVGAAVAFAAPPSGNHGNGQNAGVFGASGPSGPHGNRGQGHGNAGTLNGPSGPSGPHGNKGQGHGNAGAEDVSGPSGPRGNNGHGHGNAGTEDVSGPSGPRGKGKGHNEGATGAGGLAGVENESGPSGPHGGKPSCVPQVTLVIKGTSAGDGSVSIDNVTGGNHFAKLLLNNTSTVNISTGPNTQVTVNGNASNAGSIKKGDHLLETFRVCKSDITGKSTNVASVSNFSTFVATLKPKKVIDQTQH